MTEDRNTDNTFSGTEREMLLLFLDNQRDIMLWKTSGLTLEQLSQRLPPSSMTLLTLLKHLANVETNWFQRRFLGADVPRAWDDPWQIESTETIESVTDAYKTAIVESNRIARDYSLEATAVDVHPLQQGVTLQWILYHMIEETARHCGHADLIREAIDGSVGQNSRFP